VFKHVAIFRGEEGVQSTPYLLRKKLVISARERSRYRAETQRSGECAGTLREGEAASALGLTGRFGKTHKSRAWVCQEEYQEVNGQVSANVRGGEEGEYKT